MGPRARVVAIAVASVTWLTACATSTTAPDGASSPPPLIRAPVGVSLLLFAGDRVRAVDWSGHEYLAPYGVPQPAPTSNFGGAMPFRPAPDGSAMLNLPVPSVMWSLGGYAGGRLAPPANLGDAMWADDSSHLCGMTSNPDHSATVWIADGAGSWSKLVSAGTWVMNGGAPQIAACSWTSGRVVVQDTGGGNGDAATVWVFSMDGRLLTTLRTAAGTWDIFTFSADASLYADYNESSGDTVVYDIAGNRVATLKGVFVEAFTWSRRYALVTDSRPDIGTRPYHNPYLMNWRTGKILWRSPAGSIIDTGVYGDVALQPDGDGIALPIESTDCVGRARCDPVLEVVSPAGAWQFPDSAYLPWWVIWP